MHPHIRRPNLEPIVVPHPFTLVADLRAHTDWSIYSAPVIRPTVDHLVEHRFAVMWDEDNDPRVLRAALSLYYRSPREFRFVHAYAEAKAHLTVFQYGFEADVQREMDAAVADFSVVEDCWSVEVVNNFLPSAKATKLPNSHQDTELAALHELFELGSFGPRSNYRGFLK